MNTSDDDIGDKKIEINKLEPLPLTSKENIPEVKKKNLNKKLKKVKK